MLVAGTFDGKLAAINYALTVYGVWYSGSLFEENGWTPPTNWAEALELGAAAKELDKYLFCWGVEAATYYQTLAVDSAIKEGGHEVRLALENLEEGCWSHPAVQGVFEALKQVVDNEYMQPGGAGTQFTAAQAQWSLDQDRDHVPVGVVDRERDEGADRRGLPDEGRAVVRGHRRLGDAGDGAPRRRRASRSSFRRRAPTSPAARSCFGIMLSTEAATNFAETKLAPTIVTGLVPEDGFGSTALVSQAEMLAAAGEDIFNSEFVDFYGTNQEQLVLWNSFLSGDSSVEDLTSGLQDITDRIREDDSITKFIGGVTARRTAVTTGSSPPPAVGSPPGGVAADAS